MYKRQVYINSRLNIIAEHMEANTLTVVLNRFCFHSHAVSHQVIIKENRSYPVKHMVSCFLYVVCDHVFKRKHTVNIEIACSSDEVFLVGVFCGELPTYQMTAVIKVAAVHIVIFCCLLYTSEPQRVYDEVVSVNPNVRMVLSGHYHNAKTVVSQFDDDGDGVNDRNVYQMLFDYQGLSEGGMGYIRLMHFDCEGEKIIIKTYSPSLDDYNAKDYPGIGGQGIVGEENFEISFADLGITPETKTVSTSGFTAEVLRNDVIGTVENVKSGETASVVWENAPEGRNGWYAEVTDQFGGITRSKVSYVTVGLSLIHI